jgi:hypothetical protein
MGSYANLLNARGVLGKETIRAANLLQSVINDALSQGLI